MHRLTPAIVRGYLPPDQADAARALLTANHPGDEALPSTWPRWAQVLVHLLALDPDASTEALVGLTFDTAWYLIRRGDARAAYDLARRLYQHNLDRIGPDDAATLNRATTVAIALREMGRYDQAPDWTRTPWPGSTACSSGRRRGGHPSPSTGQHDLDPTVAGQEATSTGQ